MKKIIKKIKIRNTKHAGIKTLILCLMIAIGTLFATMFFPQNMKQADFRVSRGQSVTVVSKSLLKNRIILSEKLFVLAVRMRGGMVQAGDYDFPAHSGIWKISGMLIRGDIAKVSFIAPEGLTSKQICQMLLANDNFTGMFECPPDGALFPDTYYVPRGAARSAVLDLMSKKMDSVIEKFAKTHVKIPKPLKDWNDVIILASIVQKETSKKSEMPKVASVYLNRLRKGMRLQACPTVVYALTDGLGDMQGQPLLSGHLTGTDSPYNTYKYGGLPPTPIANPGADAIRAVLRPADTSYLFFVADGNGGHNFSEDFDRHQGFRQILWDKKKEGKND